MLCVMVVRESGCAVCRYSVCVGARLEARVVVFFFVFFFFFQAEDGIRDAQESRGLGDVYKRQPLF